MRRFWALVSMSLATPLAFAGHVLVVGSGPGELTEVQAAVDAALDGDVILVKHGVYPSFVVPNKRVSIVADVGASPRISGAIRVRNVAATKFVVLAGLRATGRTSANPYEIHGLFTSNCAGSLRLQDCELTGFSAANAPCGIPAGDGVRLESSTDVAFVRCTVRGSSLLPRLAQDQWAPEARLGTGLRATSSNVAFYDSTAAGGSAGVLCNTTSDGAGGGDGCRLIDSFVLASNAHFQGGSGGSSSQPFAFGGHGGNGATLSSISGEESSLAYVATSFAGGDPGGAPCGICISCCNGVPGAATSAPASSLVPFPGPARRLIGANVARESTVYGLQIHAPAGELAAIAITDEAGFGYDPQRVGVELVTRLPGTPTPRATFWMIVGTVPSSGVLDTTITWPALPTSEDGTMKFVQLITRSPAGELRLGSPLMVALLDAGL